MVDGVFAHIFGEVRLQGLAFGSQAGCRHGFGCLGEGADFGIAGQEADIGCALEQVAGQDVDGHPGAGVEVKGGFLVVLAGQLVEQLAGQLVEILAHAGNICTGAEQLAEQAQVVVGGLDFGQALLVGAQPSHETGQIIEGVFRT